MSWKICRFHNENLYFIIKKFISTNNNYKELNKNIIDANLNENTEFVSNFIFYTDIKEVFTDDELKNSYKIIQK